MEKKSLGRGLEDISNIFMSASEETQDKKMTHGFSSVVIREDSCASCTNIVNDSSGYPKCRIFSLENEKYGLPARDSIKLSYAKYCECFESVSEEDTKTKSAEKDDSSNEIENQCEIDETLILRKRITFQHDENVQQSLRKILFKHLEEGYDIYRIDLKKYEDISEPRSRVRKQQDVMIYIKSS